MAFTNTFKPTDFTIVIDDKPVTSFSSKIVKLPEPKPEVPQRKYNLNTDYKVAGRSFAEYVTRRMLKDGIGFCPIADYRESATNLYGYIQAPVPKTDGDFLAYCHELGHCKSRPMTAQEQMEYFLFEDGRVSGERYKAREQYWQDKGLWHSGYFPDTQQINLKMMLYKGEKDNLEKTTQVLEEVLPFIKERNGVKHLDIFEHTCSENGCWSVEISEGSFDLILHRWHRRSVNQSFKTLYELVQYVQEHHYYESSFDENQDDD